MGAKIPPLVTPFALVSLVLALGATNVVVNKATHTSEGAKVTSDQQVANFSNRVMTKAINQVGIHKAIVIMMMRVQVAHQLPGQVIATIPRMILGILIKLHGQQETLAQKHQQIDQQIQMKVQVLIETVPHNQLVQLLTIIQRHRTRLVVILPEQLRLNDKEAGY